MCRFHLSAKPVRGETLPVTFPRLASAAANPVSSSKWLALGSLKTSSLGPDALFQLSLTVCSSNSIVPLQKKNSFLFSLPPYSSLWGVCLKPPLTLYSQETWIPWLRECVGEIIPNPCTLNRTFKRPKHLGGVSCSVHLPYPSAYLQ